MPSTDVSIVIDKSGSFTITGKINKNPQPSGSSGKQLMLVTTGGTKESGEFTYTKDGKNFTVPVKVNLNVGIDNPDYVKQGK